MEDKLTFWGLYQVDKQADKFVQGNRKVLLTDIDDSHVQKFLQSEQEYEAGRRQQQLPFFQTIKMNTNHSYVLALRDDANQDVIRTVKGIEDHFHEHVSLELPDDEWKRRTIKILLTWNISEKKELENFAQNIKDVEIQQRNYGFIALALAIITLVAIFWMKR